jgi:hypothetical protein
MSGCTSRTQGVYAAARCRVCGTPAARGVELGGVVCAACLRRMNADPVAKRNLILRTEHFDF